MSGQLAPALRAARRALRVAGFVSFTSVMIPLYVARDRTAASADKARVRDRWLQRWSGTLLRLFGVSVTYREPPLQPFSPVRSRRGVGGEVSGEASEGRSPVGRLVVSNHRSAIDVGILLQHFGGHMVSRADLAGWPVVGAAARSVETVFVDRSSTVSGATTIRSIRGLLSRGEAVLLFPEGTTFAGDEVRPFAPGAFIGPLKTRAVIVPVGIAYATGSDAEFVGESFPQHLTRLAGGRPTRVVVHIGEPIEVTTGSRAQGLATRAREAVDALVKSARREVDAS